MLLRLRAQAPLPHCLILWKLMPAGRWAENGQKLLPYEAMTCSWISQGGEDAEHSVHPAPAAPATTAGVSCHFSLSSTQHSLAGILQIMGPATT